MATLLLLISIPGPAWGSKSWNGFIGGQAGAAGAGFFAAPRDAAVYTAGDVVRANDKVFVAEGGAFDGNSKRVLRLSVDGDVELVWGRDVIATGATGDTGTGFEVCDVSVSGAAGCRYGSPGFEEGMFDDPMGLAVNQSTGRVYVGDRDNHRVQEFTVDGGFVRAWGWGVDTGANAFEVCTSSCQAGLPGAGVGQIGAVGQFTFGSGIAVAPAAPHDVFVADPANRRVLRFNADGTLDGSPTIGGPAEFSTDHPLRVAVDADGVLYASDNSDGANRVVRHDTTTSTFLGPLTVSNVLPTGVTVGLEVDPNSSNLLVARQATGPADPVVREIADPGADLASGVPDPAIFDTHVFGIDAPLDAPVVNGLGFNPTDGMIFLTTSELRDPHFDCEQVEPTPALSCDGLVILAESGVMGAVADAPSGVGVSSADVSGVVDAGGGIASYVFEVSRDGVVWEGASEPKNVSGDGPVVVSGEQVTGLQPNSLYRLRLRVSKRVGRQSTAVVVSSEQVILTDAKAPEAQTLGSSHRTDSSARLRALVDPEGAPTEYFFEFGPVAGGSFDRRVPLTAGSAGSGNDPKLVVEQVDGLVAETAYQYRVVAENFAGTAVGETVTFLTRALPAESPAGDRAYELVSPAYKVGGQGVGEWYDGITSQAFAGTPAHNGERFGINGTLGVVLSGDGAYEYATHTAFAQRSPSGWSSSSAMTRRAFGRQNSRFLSMMGSNSDFSLTTWESNGGLLRLFEEMVLWPDRPALFARDWEGRWEVVGPTDPAQDNGLGEPFTTQHVFEDGSGVVASTVLRGVAGSGDPSLDAAPDVSNVLVDEFPDGVSDTFPGLGVRTVANVCTAGTVIPARDGAGKIADQACGAPAPNRDARLVDPRGASLGVRPSDRALARVVSEDGDRVFFMSPDPLVGTNSDPCSGTGAGTACPPQLFVRERTETGFVTRWIGRSEVADQDASLLAPVSFEGASVDGDKVVLRTAAPLTADDPNGLVGGPPPGGVTTGSANPASTDLFVYDFPDDPEADPASGDLIRVSAGPTGAADANVQAPDGPFANGASGGARFVSADGQRVYFVSAAPIPDVPVAGDGTITQPGGTAGSTDFSNLYVWDATQPVAGRWRFIARLPRTSPLGACATAQSVAGPSLTVQGNDVIVAGLSNCVRGTGDGGFVTFWSDGRLTGDDPDAVSGDVYGYDLVRDELSRLSGVQGGVGGSYQCAPDSSAVRCHGDSGVGPSGLAVPPLGVASDPSTAGVRLAFFQSRSRLVAGDMDEFYDVYEWRDGVLSLVSTGSSGRDGALYQGNDRSGDTVFFSTLDQLTWQDSDAVLDIYAARVGGGIPEPPPPPVCGVVAGGCQGPGTGVRVPAGADSTAPTGDGNAKVGERLELEAAGLSARARRLAARRGVVRLRVSALGAGRVRVLARAKVGGRVRRVGSGAVALERAGDGVVVVRLSKAARRALARGRSLRVVLSVSMDGARDQTVRATLKRGRR